MARAASATINGSRSFKRQLRDRAAVARRDKRPSDRIRSGFDGGRQVGGVGDGRQHHHSGVAKIGIAIGVLAEQLPSGFQSAGMSPRRRLSERQGGGHLHSRLRVVHPTNKRFERRRQPRVAEHPSRLDANLGIVVVDQLHDRLQRGRQRASDLSERPNGMDASQLRQSVLPCSGAGAAASCCKAGTTCRAPFGQGELRSLPHSLIGMTQQRGSSSPSGVGSLRRSAFAPASRPPRRSWGSKTR